MSDTAVLTPDPQPAGRKGRMPLVVGGTVAALLLGGGAFAAWQLLAAKGPSPEEALPATTIGVITLDTDPSAGQKVAAIKTLRKFPTLRKELGIKDDDDVREFVFDKAQEAGACEGISYQDAIKPWLGKRVGLAAVDLEEDLPTPALVVQVSDADKARAGMRDLVKECGDSADFGYTVTDDFLILSDTTEHAKRIATTGAERPLADSEAYQKWAEEVGDAGILNFYVAKSATKYLADIAPDTLGGVGQDELDAVEEAAADFEGLAGTVRFADGGMELAVSAGGGEQYVSEASVGGQVGDLPADTAVAIGLGVPGDLAQKILDQLEDAMGPELEAQLAQLEAEFGLTFPDDVQTLLGEGITFSLGGNAPESFDSIKSITEVPVGLTIQGDPDKIRGVIGKVEGSTGAGLADLGVATRDDEDTVAFAASDGYANSLLDDNGLADAKRFTSVVPEAGDASSILFVDFDSEWFDAIAKSSGDDEAEVAANLDPLAALGISAWREGDVVKGLVKLTTD